MRHYMEPDLARLRKFVAPEFIFGVGSMGLVDKFLFNLGVKNPMLVTDPGVKAAGWVDPVIRAIEKLHLSYVLFEGLTPNPKDHEVAAGYDSFRANKCDGLVAVGGGSPIDCAKGIGILAGNGGNIRDFEGVDTISSPTPPLLCIPTTAGTSADVSQFAIITHADAQRKFAIVSKAVVPDVSLIDPQTTLTMSPDLTADTGMDALCHAFEALASNASSGITDVHAIEAIRLMADCLPGVMEHPDNLEQRTLQMAASLHAGLAFSNASLGIVHAMAHALGGVCDFAHGACNSLLLSAAVEFNFEFAADKYRKAFPALKLVPSGDAATDRDALVRRIAGLRASLRPSGGEGSFAVDERVIPLLAGRAINDVCMLTNPRLASVDDVAGLYRRVLGG